jgi:glycosyltransferase involved in cell wall biosynthesis
MVRLAILRGPLLNKPDMTVFEPLLDDFQIVAFVPFRTTYDLSTVRIPLRRLLCPQTDLKFWHTPRPVRLFDHVRPIAESRLPYMLGLTNALRGFDIVDSAETFFPISLAAIRAKAKWGCKVVLNCSETIPFIGENRCESIARVTKRNADLFFPVSAAAKMALQLEGIPAERIEIVTHGVDCARFHPEPKDPHWLAQHDLRIEDKIILFAGRMEWHKGIHDVLLAARYLLDDPEMSDRRLRFVFKGSGVEADASARFAGRLGLAPHVRFLTGKVYSDADMPRYYNAADICVFPSKPLPTWEEQFGIVLIEAMACGKPVVSTRCGAIPEVLDDAGILIAPGDAVALAGAIKQLATDSELARRLSHAARTRALDRFDHRLVAARRRAIYQRLLSEARA